jgi:FkbM family methyltransferase
MAQRVFSSMPPRVFRTIRLLPGIGDAMLRMVDATYPPHALLVRRIRKGPLRDMVLEVDPRALDMVIGSYEPAIQSLIEETLRPGDVAFDVGSNLGYFTLLMATKVGHDGRVVAFEPDPEMFSALERNLDRNSDAAASPVRALSVAAGAAQGKVRFARGWRATRGRIVATGGDFDVDVITIDEASKRHGLPRLLKIDVEGGELDVLRGAGSVLTQARPLVLVEVHSTELEIQCASFLESLGYTCSRRVDIGKKEPYLLAV